MTSSPERMPPGLRYRLWALCVLCGLPYAAVLLRGGFLTPRSVLVLLAIAAVGALVLARVARTWRRLFMVYFPLWLVSLAYAALVASFSIRAAHVFALALVSTSWEEVQGLLSVSRASFWLALFAGVIGLYVWLVWRLPPRRIVLGEAHIRAPALLAVGIAVLIYAAWAPRQLMDGIEINPVSGGLVFLAQIPRAAAELHGHGIRKTPYQAHREDNGEEVHVLVVGESARRASWSVYGYSRPTTPYLQRIRAELLLLTRAMADANLTTNAVAGILTGMMPAQIRLQRPHGNLLDLVKEAGYSTAWLVNQDSGPSSALGVTADDLRFPPEPLRGFLGHYPPDETLLPAYRRELARAGVARFIGLHIMESHWEYYRRYPPQFQRFGSAVKLGPTSTFSTDAESLAELTDTYDDSVLYTDWFLGQLIEAARSLRVPVTLTFVPDHGESLPALDGGAAGHGLPFYSRAQYEIPAFVWVNDAYRAAHPGRVAALEGNLAKEVRSHDFFYTVADLMGISWPQADPRRSFASAQFSPDDSGQYLVGARLVRGP